MTHSPISLQFSADLPVDAYFCNDWRIRVYGRVFRTDMSGPPLSARALMEYLLEAGDEPLHHAARPKWEKLAQCDGEFIAVIENRRCGHAWVCADPLGNMRAHWIETDQHIHLAERPAPLLSLLAANGPVRLNRERLLSHFAASGVAADGCFFAHMHSLLPGHVLHVRTNPDNRTVLASCQPYYRLPESPLWKNIQQPASAVGSQEELDDWAHRLRTSLNAAINRYWPESSTETVALSLSGGLDSGLIAGLLAKRCQATGQQATGISYLFKDAPRADESQWIRQYAHTPLSTHTFDASHLLPLNAPWPVLPDAPTSSPYRHIKHALYQHSQHLGCAQLFTGVYADHLYSGWIYHGMDRWRHSPWQGLLYCLTHGPGIRRRLAPLAPGKWRRMIRHRCDWLQPEAQKALAAISPWPGWHRWHPHPAQALLTGGLYAADSVWLEAIFARQNDIQLVHPYRYRPLVETIMGIPAWVLGNPHDTKRLARRAIRGLVTEDIAQRRQPRSLTPVFVAGVLQKNRDMVQDMLYRRGANWQEFVDKKAIERVLKNPHADHSEASYVALWQCLSYELWRYEVQKRIGQTISV